jgi:hypothetical protein
MNRCLRLYDLRAVLYLLARYIFGTLGFITTQCDLDNFIGWDGSTCGRVDSYIYDMTQLLLFSATLLQV